MKRVVMLIQRYLPHVGGAERQLQQLAPRLRARGFDIHIITRREKGLLPFERIDDVPVYRMASVGPKAIAAATFTAAALFQMTQLKPAIVHAHEILTPASIAVLSKRINGHPVLVKVLRGGARGDIYKLKRRPFWKSYFANLNRHVDAFITISKEIDDELAALHVCDQKRIALPNGVDTARYLPASEELRQKLRAELGLPLRSMIAVYAGRLVAEKRVDLLLTVWSQAREKYHDAQLLILGDGVEESRLKGMSVDGVQFMGHVNEAWRYLQAVDLFVLPSSTEGLSNSMLEAMSCGLPVLATTVGGAPDVIEHGKSGYLIPADDMDALQRGLLTLLGDDTLRFAMGAAARERIVADFSLDSVADRLAALYNLLLREK
jgi:glycosyltransferase involved in cell wall biosynthesis